MVGFSSPQGLSPNLGGPSFLWGIIVGMGIRRQHLFIPSIITAGSLAALLIFGSLTSPLDNVSYSIVFFGLALIFLVAGGYLLTYLRRGQVAPKSRSRILIVSLLILIALMLRSSGSLNFLEAGVLVLIGVGLWFYSGRRSV